MGRDVRRTRTHVFARALACVVLAAVPPCRDSHTNPLTAGPRLNVVFITLDTTRADRIGAYGFGDAGTPNIDRLAREGALFEQAESVAPLTLPAHCSLFTGRFPFEHGVHENGAPLPAQERTLAQVLQAAGMRTGAFTASFVLDPRWGLARGFDRYEGTPRVSRTESGRGSDRRPANEVVDHALAWLASTPPHPFFVWLHFYDAHGPYDAAGREGRVPGYQPAIGFMDGQIGRLLAFLDVHRVRDRTVIVIVGDHGESLGDHGELTHGLFVYESVTRVPLIIAAPNDDGVHGRRRVAAVVRSVDVMPTIMNLLHLPTPSSSMSGRSLVPLMTGRVSDSGLQAYAETMFPRDRFGWSELRAVREGRFKFIAAPRPELYDLQSDSDERVNLYEVRPTLAARLAEALRVLKGSNTVSAQTFVDPDAAARLAALGYVGNLRAPSARDDVPLADPKDKISLYLLITRDRTRDVPYAGVLIPHR